MEQKVACLYLQEPLLLHKSLRWRHSPAALPLPQLNRKQTSFISQVLRGTASGTREPPTEYKITIPVLHYQPPVSWHLKFLTKYKCFVLKNKTSDWTFILEVHSTIGFNPASGKCLVIWTKWAKNVNKHFSNTQMHKQQ